MEWNVFGGVLIFLGTWAVAFGVGVATERKGWKMRAARKNRDYGSSHHCDGEFYVIFEESYFIENYVLGRRSRADG